MNEYDIIAHSVSSACGGPKNIRELTCCATRLRFKFENQILIDETALKKIPSLYGLIHRGSELHLVFGVDAIFVYKEFTKLMKE